MEYSPINYSHNSAKNGANFHSLLRKNGSEAKIRKSLRVYNGNTEIKRVRVLPQGIYAK